MIPNYNPVTQALLGTLFTWGVTAFGSALVFVFNHGQVWNIELFSVVVCCSEQNEIRLTIYPFFKWF